MKKASFALVSTGSRNEIISYLAGKKPLSPKDIHQGIRQSYQSDYSYQGVHKMIMQLEGEGILVMQDKKYQLNPEWVTHSKRFFSELEKNLTKKEDLPETFGAHTELRFCDINQFCTSMAIVFTRLAKTMKPTGNTIAFIENAWFPISFSFNDFSLLRQMSAHTPGTPFVLIKTQSAFNEWVKHMYHEAGFHVEINPTFQSDIDYGAIGQYYWQAQFSTESKKTIANIYSKINHLLDLFGLYATTLVNKPPKVDIRVTIQQNPQLAQMAFDQIARGFQEQKKLHANSPYRKN